MRALAWHGKHDIRCNTVPDPTIEHSRDAIIKVKGVDKLVAQIGARPVEALLANAGRGLGRRSSTGISVRSGVSATPISPEPFI